MSVDLILITVMLAIVCTYGVVMFILSFCGSMDEDDPKDKIGTSNSWWHS